MILNAKQAEQHIANLEEALYILSAFLDVERLKRAYDGNEQTIDRAVNAASAVVGRYKHPDGIEAARVVIQG